MSARSRLELLAVAIAAAGLLAVPSAGDPPAPTAVSVVPAAAAEGPAVEATLVATPAGGRGGGEGSNEGSKPEPLERRITVPWHGDLALDPRVVWRLSVRAPGFWAADGVAVPGRGSAPTLTLWPVATLSGSIRPPPNEAAPAELGVRFSPVPSRSQGGKEELPEGTVACQVEDLRWNCEVPAGKLDLRLRAAGFISDYRWGVDLAAGKRLELGEVALRRGASVVGFVAVEDGVLDPGRCEVWLAPATGGPPAAYEDLERRRGLRASAAVDERGFFHFQGVPPGSYELTAEQPGLAPARQFPVPVAENSETQLRHPLLLRRPRTLRVEIEPPLDPFGDRWSLRLLPRATPSQPGSGEIVELGRAAEDGRHEKAGLAPGDYVLQVFDSRGARSGWEEFTLGAESGPIRVVLDLTSVEGRVLLGEEPLAARLAFGGRRGTRRIDLASDDEGEFSGVLPRPGEWTVHVEAESPSVRRTLEVEVEPEGEPPLARLEIRLPDSRIAGETVDEEGSPLSGAMVKAADPEAGEVVWTASGEDGRFSLSGIAEGTVVLDARREGAGGATLESAPQVVPVVEGRHTEDLRLVLRAMAQVSGQVIGGGRPVPGALVEAVPKKAGREVPFALMPEATTDVAGQFRFEVPADADSVDIRVLPPGFVLTRATLAGVPREPVTLAVEESGGTLVLEANAVLAAEDRSRPQPVILHRGAVLSLLTLRRWAAINGAENGDPTRLVVPQLPPGDYTACWLGLEDYLGDLPGPSGPGGSLAGLLRRLAAAGRCVSGDLNVHGELSLTLPSAEAATADEPAGR